MHTFDSRLLSPGDVAAECMHQCMRVCEHVSRQLRQELSNEGE